MNGPRAKKNGPREVGNTWYIGTFGPRGEKMARDGPRGKFFPFAPPPPPGQGQEVSPVDETWTLGMSIGPPRFFDLFFGPRPKVFEKHWSTTIHVLEGAMLIS